MISEDKHKQLVQTCSDQLLQLLKNKTNSCPGCYGFEYELIPAKQLTLNDMDALYAFMPTQGFTSEKGYYTLPSGMCVNFEPGGQIEFCSMPMDGWSPYLFAELVEQIETTTAAIQKELGIEYMAVGYIPGRADAPLCLTSDRYKNLHNRMPHCGTRGREMMKGTASVHIHASIGDPANIGPLFARFIELSASDEFAMSSDRRDIWDNTDPSRSGMPFTIGVRKYTPIKMIEEYVRFSLEAEDLDENILFKEKKNITFEMFLEHITTLFIDVRINMKGPSIELRTLDSLPLKAFEEKWKLFIVTIEELKKDKQGKM